MYFVVITCVTLLTLLLPVLIPRIARRYHLALQPAPLWLPVLAAIVYFSAGFLPDIHISHETNSFQEHFVGGGLYTAILFLYFTKLFSWRKHWLIMLLALFAWTSALGTANELLEFTLVKLNITQIDISDTSWDLVANTAGMLTGFIIWRFAGLISKNQRGKS